MKSKLGAIILVVPFAYYLVVGLFQIEKPGLYYDEAFHLLPAVDLIQQGTQFHYNSSLSVILRDGRPPLISRHHISPCSDRQADPVEEKTFPLMLINYLGALKTYLFAIVFWLLGVDVAAVRITTVALGFLVLILVYLWTSRLFGRRAALLSLVLLASDPNYVFHTRMDFGPVVLMLIFKMASLHLLLNWWRKDSSISLITAFFCLGLGLWDKANFLWFIAALLLAGVFIGGRSLWRRLKFRTAILGGAAFAIGAGPLILLNVLNRGGTFLKVLGRDSRTHRSLFDLTDNIGTSLRVLFQTLSGFWLERQVFLDHFPVNLIFPYLFLFSLVAFICMCRQSEYIKAVNHRPVYFVLILLSGTLLFTLLTPQTWGGHHILMIYPFPHIISGAVLGACWSFRLFKSLAGKILLAASGALLIVTLYTNLKATFILHRAFATNRLGWRAWSNTLTDLADYLSEHPETKTVCLDWGFYRNLVVSTGGKVRMEEIYQDLTDQKSTDVFRDYFPDENYRYLLHPANMNLFPDGYRLFQKALGELAYQAHLEISFSDWRGREIMRLYRVAPLSPVEGR